MSKYIIKNCPAYSYLGKECHNGEGQYGASCCEVTDCAMKQIVEKCKRTLSINKGFEKEFTLGKMTFADFILKDIDIQEIKQ